MCNASWSHLEHVEHLEHEHAGEGEGLGAWFDCRMLPALGCQVECCMFCVLQASPAAVQPLGHVNSGMHHSDDMPSMGSPAQNVARSEYECNFTSLRRSVQVDYDGTRLLTSRVCCTAVVDYKQQYCTSTFH